MKRSPRLFLCLLAFLSALAHGNVLINEVMTAGSERALQWSAQNVPQFGYGTPWHSTAFNDGSWRTGNGPFGFGSFANASPAAVGTNTATQMQNLTPTLYLRKSFTVSAADAARADAVQLDVQFNDGFVCYINGVEVIRRNAGPAKQFVYRDQFAAFGTPANNESSTTPYLRTETLTLPAASTLLVPGNNVVAIHALNYWETTSVINANNAFASVDNRNNFYFKADLRIGADAPLVTNNSQWRYFPGVVEPSGGVFDPALLFSAKQAVPWGRTAFDDAGWSSGSAPFGAGTPPSGVALGTNLTSQVISSATSVYFRIVFTATAADLADGAALQLLMDHDDSFVAYLNGVEVARDRLGQANAFTPHNAVADSARTPGSSATYTLDPPSRLLLQGQNVLAVQVHNLSKNDLDLFFRCRLQRTGGARILVDYTNAWRYFVGVEEPIQAVGEAEEENPEAPDSQLDWVELHNSGAAPIALGGWFLSDDPADRTKWKFPAGASIPAGGYLVVICDGANITSPASGGYLHTNFSLSRSGETVGLYNSTAQIVHELPVPALGAFQSYGRASDGQYRYLGPPTPAAENAATSFEGVVAAPAFSVPGGFYSSTQSVALSTGTPGASIRYTVDGTEPTETTGVLYTNPLTVAQGTVNGPGVAIRARAFKAGMIASATKTNTYLINQSAARSSVPALCITGDQQRSLYRPFGIMAISGGAFTDMASPLPEGNDGIWTQAGRNTITNADLSAYNNAIHRGRFTEKPAVMEVFYPGGAPGVNIDFGMRISGSGHARPRFVLANQNRVPGSNPAPNDGAWSANSAQKPSFNFYFRGDLGGDPLEFKLFPESPVTMFHDVRVRAGKNDPSNPFIEDEFVRRLFVDLGQVGSTGMINTLYVNGVYKGYYNMCEHLREEFFQQQHGSDLSWDVRQVTTIASGDGLAFQEMITFLRNNPQSLLANYQAMKTRLDMVNFVDYLIVNLFGVTGDWPHNNFVCARERSASGLHRYYVWDAEGAFGDFSGNVRTNQFASGTTGSIITTSPATVGLGEGIRILYTLLKVSPEFRQLFADRLQKHFFNNGALTEARVISRWNTMKSEFAPILGGTVTDRVTPWVNGVGDATRYTTSGATNSPSRRNVLFNGYIDDTVGGAFVPPHLVAEGLWPTTRAPQFSPFGGVVAPGSNLTITDPNAGGAGAIYYTLDGRDPRAEGGAIVGEAYTGPITIDFSTTVRARVRNSNGQWSPLTEAFFDTGAPPPLLITEIMYHPADNGAINGDEYEFLELKNVGTQPLNLHGLRFSSGITYAFPAGATIAPGGHRVIARNAAAFSSRYPGVPVLDSWGPGSNLSNSGETLTLVDAVGRTVFSVTWSDTAPWPVAPDGNGQSLVPVSASAIPSPNDPTNWRASTENGGSPGADDPTPSVLPVYISELLANPTMPGADRVELHNPGGNPVDVGNWWLSDDITLPKKYRIPAGTMIPGGGFLVIEEAAFNAGATPFAFSSAGDEAILSSADVTGSLTGYSHIFRFGASDPGVSFGRYINSVGAEFFPAQVVSTFGGPNAGPKVGPVVLTELMVLPLSGGDEFVEIQNTSSSPVPLYDAVNPTNTWRIDGIAFSFPTGVVLQPGQIAIVSPIAPATFSSKYSIPTSVPVFGPYTGALNNAGERIALQKPGPPSINSGGLIVVPYIDVDFVTYDDGSPWPGVAGNGRSLERLNAHSFGDDPVNWQASPAGATLARPVSLSITTWLSQHFTPAQLNNSAIGARNADPDGDGLDNLREWAQGSDPLSPGTSSMTMSIETHTDGQPYLTLRYRRNLGAASLSAFADTAAAIGTWNQNAGITVGAPVNNGNGTETVTVRDTAPANGQSSRFMRLRFTAP